MLIEREKSSLTCVQLRGFLIVLFIRRDIFISFPLVIEQEVLGTRKSRAYRQATISPRPCFFFSFFLAVEGSQGRRERLVCWHHSQSEHRKKKKKSCRMCCDEWIISCRHFFFAFLHGAAASPEQWSREWNDTFLLFPGFRAAALNPGRMSRCDAASVDESSAPPSGPEGWQRTKRRLLLSSSGWRDGRAAARVWWSDSLAGDAGLETEDFEDGCLLGMIWRYSKMHRNTR